MVERPILYSGPMVRALLDGRKTVTRRLLKPQPAPNSPYDGGTKWVYDARTGLHIPCGSVGHLTVAEKMGLRCPYGQPGDSLWVRETWALEDLEGDGQRVVWKADRAAAWCANLAERFYLASDYEPLRWTPSIHMPRWANRLTDEVVSVRAERLHDITEADARAEGMQRYQGPLRWVRWLDVLTGEPIHNSARDAFAAYFVTLPGGADAWARNDWVWRVETRRVEGAA
ncbi:hypothetical protein HRD49_43310 [Corallococcus exiguus]|uniref:hypothetical protein n=1 Tax=Corallococcus exiguus TaxID=83462 RepID=UPI0014725EAA|nr:hypothetical protein [Corallococcus exiguus]NNC22393.1 hypothetical protein [Corallococcus exiguus]NRD68570.1 hypothetical protein [Corallococcus exiguus]